MFHWFDINFETVTSIDKLVEKVDVTCDWWSYLVSNDAWGE